MNLYLPRGIPHDVGECAWCGEIIVQVADERIKVLRNGVPSKKYVWLHKATGKILCANNCCAYPRGDKTGD